MNCERGQARAGALIVAVVVLAAVVAVVVAVRMDTTGEKGSGLGDEYSYDLEPHRRTGRELIRYEESASIDLKLEEPRGLAMGLHDRLHIAGDERIVVLGEDGAHERDIDVAAPANCVAVAADGTLYVGVGDHVEVFGPDGKPKATWEGVGKDAEITAIAVAEGNVFAADWANRVVLRYDESGKLLGRIGEKDEERRVPGLIVPSAHLDMAIGPDGLLYVVNPGRQRIEAYTFDGDLEAWWGQASQAIEGFCGCCNPTNLAIFPDGRFVTSEKGLPRVKVYSPEGKLECVVAAPDRFAEEASGLDLAVDSRGRILVLDPGAKRVRIFTREGQR